MTAQSKAALVAALMALAPGLASAQGTLSTQGLGFPPGQLSTPATSMGGAIGEADPMSPLNPAAIGLVGFPILYMQAEPEFRTMTVGDRKERTSVARFPVFIAILPLGSRWALSASASTLLDRTWATITRDTQFVGGDTLGSDLLRKSDGSVADLRLALAFAPAPWLRIGIGGHSFSGRDLVEASRRFDDTAHFAPDTQQTALSFGGYAASLGMQAFWARKAAVGLTYRRGGTFRTFVEGDVQSVASAPDHLGVSVVYLGLQGTSLAVRAAKDTWSRMVAISPTLNAHDGWDVGVGADVTGPRFGGSPVALRAGGRWRTLPFSAAGTAVKERTVSGGFGLPMAGGRVELNVGALRASRTGDAGISEKAWTISTGFAVRP
jgi:hypothetical protein